MRGFLCHLEHLDKDENDVFARAIATHEIWAVAMRGTANVDCVDIASRAELHQLG